MQGENVYPSSNGQPCGVPWNGAEPVSARNSSVIWNVLEFQAMRLIIEDETHIALLPNPVVQHLDT